MIRKWWKNRQIRKARRYLGTHPEVTLHALRAFPDLAADAVARTSNLDAAGGPDRQTMMYPILTGIGTGARSPIAMALPKASPFNLRRFCFDAQTDVLTQRGWIPWPQITKDDVFATINIETMHAEWQSASRLYQYRVDGPMVRFLSRDIDALVTPEHKMLGRFRKNNDVWNGELECPECGNIFRHASGLGAHRRYMHQVHGTWKTARNNGKSYRYSPVQLVEARDIQEWMQHHSGSASAFEIPMTALWSGRMPDGYDSRTGTVPVLCDGTPERRGQRVSSKVVRVALNDLIAFFGIYIAEGSSTGTYDGMDITATSKLPRYQQAVPPDPQYRPHAYAVRISQTEQGKWAEVEQLLLRLPWRFRHSKDHREFSVSDRYLWEMVHMLGNTYTKYVPQWIKDLPPQHIRVFIEWAIKGDGCITQDGCRLYFTTSQRLANDMQELFQRAGSAARLRCAPSKGSLPWGVAPGRGAPLYTVQEKSRAFYGVHRRHVAIEDYHGDVYCAELPNKTVYVRRNGKAYWCGRSEYPPARRAINALCNPIMDMPWSIDPVDPLTLQPVKEPDDDQIARAEVATRVLREPNDDDSWRVLLEMVLEDIVIGGYGAIEVGRNDDSQRPVYLWPVDGQTIRINVQWNGEPDKTRYTQSLGYVGISVSTERSVELRDDQLIYMKLNPRTNSPFGLGYLEVAFSTVNAYLGAFGWSERRASNATPQYALYLGEHIDIPTARAWQTYWRNDIEGNGQVPIIGGGRSPQVLQLSGGGDGELFLKWQEFLLRVIAMAFGLSPMKLGLERDINRNTASVQAEADWETVAPLANTVRDYLTTKLLWKILGWRDLRFNWMVRSQDEMRQAQIFSERYDANSITPDEIREFYEQEPLPDGRGAFLKSEYEAQAQGMTLPALPEIGGPPSEEEEASVAFPVEAPVASNGHQ